MWKPCIRSLKLIHCTRLLVAIFMQSWDQWVFIFAQCSLYGTIKMKKAWQELTWSGKLLFLLQLLVYFGLWVKICEALCYEGNGEWDHKSPSHSTYTPYNFAHFRFRYYVPVPKSCDRHDCPPKGHWHTREPGGISLPALHDLSQILAPICFIRIGRPIECRRSCLAMTNFTHNVNEIFLLLLFEGVDQDSEDQDTNYVEAAQQDQLLSAWLRK